MPAKPGAGSKVTTPVEVATVYVPCSATTSEAMEVVPSSSRTDAGTMAADGPALSLANGEISTFESTNVVMMSGFATGGGAGVVVDVGGTVVEAGAEPTVTVIVEAAVVPF
jgi:hypothetical protein